MKLNDFILILDKPDIKGESVNFDFKTDKLRQVHFIAITTKNTTNNVPSVM